MGRSDKHIAATTSHKYETTTTRAPFGPPEPAVRGGIRYVWGGTDDTMPPVQRRQVPGSATSGFLTGGGTALDDLIDQSEIAAFLR
jgi:hypothetical protein